MSETLLEHARLPDGTEPGPHVRRDVAVLLVMMFAFPAFQSLVQTLVPLRMGDLGFAESTVGIVQALPGLVALATGAPLARLANTRWRRHVLLGAFATGIAAAAAFGPARTAAALVVPQFLIGLTTSAYYANMLPTAFRLATGEAQQRIQGHLTAVQGVGFFAGPLLGGYLSERSYALGFAAGAACAALGLLASWRLSRSRAIERSAGAWRELRGSYARLAHVFRRRSEVLLGAAFVFMNIGLLLVMGGSFMLLYAERIGVSQFVASALISGRELFASLVRLTYGSASRRVRPVVLLGAGTIVGSLSMAFVPASSGVEGLVVVALGIGLGIAYLPPAVNMLSGASVALREQSFAVVSLNISNFAAQTVLAPLFGGLLTLAGYGLAYPLVAAVWSAVAVGLTFRGLRMRSTA